MTFPEDIVELHAPDENEFFHTDDEIPPLEDEETNVQTHQPQNTQNQEEGEIPDRLSPNINYIPAGGEEEETASSQESVLELETTVEDGLADFFHNPSYRSTNPSLRQPVETEEDWGDTPPVELSDQISPLQPRQNTRFDTFKEEEREEDKTEERETKIIIIVIISIKIYSTCLKNKEIETRTKIRRINLNQKKTLVKVTLDISQEIIDQIELGECCKICYINDEPPLIRIRREGKEDIITHKFSIEKPY